MYLLIASAVLLAAAAFSLAQRSAERRLMALNWPQRQTYFAMLRRTAKYLRKSGWSVPAQHGARSDCIVIRRSKSGECIIRCNVTGLQNYELELLDFQGMPAYMLIRHTRLLITAAEVPWHVDAAARSRNLFVLHYKELWRLKLVEPVSVASLQQHLTEICKAAAIIPAWRRAELEAQEGFSANGDVTSPVVVAAPEREPPTRESIAAKIAAHLAEAVILREQGEFAEAAALCRDALALNPSHQGAHMALVSVLERQNDIDLAIEAAQEALRITPKNAAMLVRVGQLRLGQRASTQAEAVFESALAIDPHHPGALFGKATALHQQGRIEDAIEVAQAAVLAHPNSAFLQVRLGQLLEHSGQSANAESAFEKACALDPMNTQALHSLQRLRLAVHD